MYIHVASTSYDFRIAKWRFTCTCSCPATYQQLEKCVDFAVIRLLQGVLKFPCLSFRERLHVDYSDFDRDSKTAVGING